jgi:hypothetical protein
VRISRCIAIAILLLPSAFGTAFGQDKKIQRSDLPPAVEKTVAAQSQGATIRGFGTETEGGHTYYEVEMTVNGRTRDMLIESDGSIAEVEDEVVLDKLPAPVKAGLMAQAGKGSIGKVESVTKKGKLVSYEAVVTTNGKRSGISVGPDGKAVK